MAEVGPTFGPAWCLSHFDALLVAEGQRLAQDGVDHRDGHLRGCSVINSISPTVASKHSHLQFDLKMHDARCGARCAWSRVGVVCRGTGISSSGFRKPLDVTEHLPHRGNEVNGGCPSPTQERCILQDHWGTQRTCGKSRSAPSSSHPRSLRRGCLRGGEWGRG